ncbi:hypothetical protein EBR77_03865 [bacterium]|nr:hypothetical protein [bacterium]
MKKLLFLGLLGLSSIQMFSAAGGGGAAENDFIPAGSDYEKEIIEKWDSIELYEITPLIRKANSIWRIINKNKKNIIDSTDTDTIDTAYKACADANRSIKYYEFAEKTMLETLHSLWRKYVDSGLSKKPKEMGQWEGFMEREKLHVKGNGNKVFLDRVNVCIDQINAFVKAASECAESAKEKFVVLSSKVKLNDDLD